MKAGRSAGVLLAAFVVPVLTVTTVMAAASPRFIKADASVDSAGGLVTSWKEAGVGGSPTVGYVAVGDANGIYACLSGGAQEAVSGTVAGSASFTPGRNGQISASLMVAPPGPTLTCPTGQQLVLACVTYSNIALMDTTNGINASVPSSLFRTFFAVPGCP